MVRPSPQPRVFRHWIGFIALFSLGYGAWRWSDSERSSRGPAPSAKSGLLFEPTEQERQTMAALKARLNPDNPRFAPEDARRRENAKLFTYMAATSEEPLVVQASLEAIQAAYSPRSSKKAAPDDDLDHALLKHLRSEQGAIARAAFSAARVPLLAETPRPELVLTLARMAAPDEPSSRRYAALEVLNLLQPDRRMPETLDAFVEALGALEPHLVSAGLFALAQSGPAFETTGKPASLGARVLELTEHPDPGVRGRALALLGELTWLADARSRLARARASLADAHPYVRAEAAALLAKSQDRSSVHPLMALIEDMAVAQYDLVGWSTLEGKPGRLTHLLPGRERVCEATLHAVRALTESSSHPLLVAVGGPRQTQESLREAITRSKAWYAQVRAALPAASSVLPTPTAQQP